MRDPFAGYDAWLERPYQDMIEESDRYYEWCEEHDMDPDDEDAVTAYNLYLEDSYDYYLEDEEADYNF